MIKRKSYPMKTAESEGIILNPERMSLPSVKCLSVRPRSDWSKVISQSEFSMSKKSTNQILATQKIDKLEFFSQNSFFTSFCKNFFFDKNFFTIFYYYIGWKSLASWVFFVTELGRLSQTVKSYCQANFQNDPKLASWLDRNSSQSDLNDQVPSQKILNWPSSFAQYNNKKLVKKFFCQKIFWEK